MGLPTNVWAGLGAKVGTVAAFAEDYAKSKVTVETTFNNRNNLGMSKTGIINIPIPGAGFGMEVALGMRAGAVQATESGIVNLSDSRELQSTRTMR